MPYHHTCYECYNFNDIVRLSYTHNAALIIVLYMSICVLNVCCGHTTISETQRLKVQRGKQLVVECPPKDLRDDQQ